MLVDLGSIAGSSQATQLSLTTQTIRHQATSGTLRAGVRFNTDGTVDKRVGDTYSQINAASDWITPRVGLSPGDYHVRANEVGDGLFGVDTENVWHALSSAREWYNVRINADGDGSYTSTLTVDLSDDGGSTIAVTKVYTLIVDNI